MVQLVVATATAVLVLVVLAECWFLKANSQKRELLVEEQIHQQFMLEMLRFQGKIQEGQSSALKESIGGIKVKDLVKIWVQSNSDYLMERKLPIVPQLTEDLKQVTP